MLFRSKYCDYQPKYDCEELINSPAVIYATAGLQDERYREEEGCDEMEDIDRENETDPFEVSSDYAHAMGMKEIAKFKSAPHGPLVMVMYDDAKKKRFAKAFAAGKGFNSFIQSYKFTDFAVYVQGNDLYWIGFNDYAGGEKPMRGLIREVKPDVNPAQLVSAFKQSGSLKFFRDYTTSMYKYLKVVYKDLGER